MKQPPHDKPPSRRGRPAAKVFACWQVAELLGVPEDRVRRALEMAPAVFLPGSWKDDEGEWCVPEKAMRGLLGPDLPRLFSVADFAELVGLSVPWMYELIALGVVECRMILGAKRVPATAYWNMPPHRPACVPPRPDFSGEEAA